MLKFSNQLYMCAYSKRIDVRNQRNQRRIKQARKYLKSSAVILGLLAAIVLLSLVGRMEEQDQGMVDAHYCEMVEAGHWPAYRDVECKGVSHGHN